MREPQSWARRHVRDLVPYTAARHLYGVEAEGLVLLDANENPYSCPAGDVGTALNRYPDPGCTRLRSALAAWLEAGPERIWVGNGSDEALALLIRVFAAPGEAVTVCSPTYGMYAVAAAASGVRALEAALDEGFDLDVAATLDTARETRMIFACSPNNPTGNLLSEDRVLAMAAGFDGPVIVDEAYVEFSGSASLARHLRRYRNLVVLRTFSKAWGLAGARVGYIVADPEIVELVSRIALPYPLNALSAAAALAALRQPEVMGEQVARIVNARDRLAARLTALDLEVLPSQANFVLVRVPGAKAIQRRLVEAFGIVVRYRGSLPRLENYLRVSVGTPEDTERLCKALKEILG